MVLYLLLLAFTVTALAALLLWGTSLPPTRPRPRSRHRGPTFTDVDDRYRRMRRK